MNISIIGDKGNVRFDVIYGDGNSDEGIVLHIDWDRVKQDGESPEMCKNVHLIDWGQLTGGEYAKR